MPDRLPVTKTAKCYVGGAFIRSESGRVFAVRAANGAFAVHVPQCSRKDLRNAVEAAAAAGPGWARRSGYNRGQILYRIAEMIEARSEEMIAALRLHGSSAATARREVGATIDRLVHYAGWTDKYPALLGSVNPVASPHFNFTVAEPVGITGLIAPREHPLLALVSLLAPALAAGNTVVALASDTQPCPAIALGEMLATSDLPGGVVNLLTGSRAELIPVFASHAHLRALSAVADAPERQVIRLAAAESVKRLRLIDTAERRDWFADAAQGLEEIRHAVEFKTTWHPIGA